MVPAQRIDLELSGVDDGLHSFGQGIWMFHDHVEKAFTTNGVGEGGDISLVVYKDFLDEKGIPKAHGMSLAPYFTKGFWKRNYPIWQDFDEWRSLGLPDLKAQYQPSKAAVQTVQPQWAPATPAAAAEQESSAFGKLLFGLILGLLSYVLFVNRQTIIARLRKLLNK
jgi:hypothetical protein